MRILFVTVAPVEPGAAGLTSFLASARYRAIIPAEQLARRGHEVHVRSAGEGEWGRDIVEFACDVLVVSKSLARANERLAAGMQARGVKVVVDICDNVFGDARYGEHFRAMAKLADAVTANTEAMAQAIRIHTGRESTVITDPIEGRRGPPRFAPRLPAIRMLWFGGPSSLEGLAERTAELNALCEVIPVHLTIVTMALPAVKQLAARLAAADPSRLRVALVPWTLEATWRALEECDVVWIPSGAAEAHATKSPNRLVESLWAGRLAVVDAISAYVPFEGAVPVGRPLAEAIFDSLADAAEVEARIADVQRRIARLHSPYACGLGWAAALGDESRLPLRLNLGCGGRILPGYVNVDRDARAGVRPDVLADSRDLAMFDDGTADEVLAVHELERFPRTGASAVLREWKRVLKPGGQLVVEGADLAGAGRALFEDAARPGAAEESLAAFYGDAADSDPARLRRWGYTRASLRALISEAGFADVREEPARFAMPQAIGMRLAGSRR